MLCVNSSWQNYNCFKTFSLLTLPLVECHDQKQTISFTETIPQDVDDKTLSDELIESCV